MEILAIDPGTRASALVHWNPNPWTLRDKDILSNNDMLEYLSVKTDYDLLLLEMVASYGMPVGREIFETVFWTGRFAEAAQSPFELVYRKDVKLWHCGSTRAKDNNIWQALVDKYGSPGVKDNPGLTYGLKKDMRAAFAIATYFTESFTERVRKEEI